MSHARVSAVALLVASAATAEGVAGATPAADNQITEAMVVIPRFQGGVDEAVGGLDDRTDSEGFKVTVYGSFFSGDTSTGGSYGGQDEEIPYGGQDEEIPCEGSHFPEIDIEGHLATFSSYDFDADEAIVVSLHFDPASGAWTDEDGINQSASDAAALLSERYSLDSAEVVGWQRLLEKLGEEESLTSQETDTISALAAALGSWAEH